MSDYCPPPLYQEPPPLVFEVHEKAVEHPANPAGNPDDWTEGDWTSAGDETYEADLGYRFASGFASDEFLGPVTSFYNYRINTIGITKTLSLKGPPVPIRITWKHHSVVFRSSPTDPGYDDTITDDEVTLTPAAPEFTWPTGYEDPGAEVEDFRSEYDDNFECHRAA